MVVLQTGQSDCYDEYGSKIPCKGTGQDGEYQKGLPIPKNRFVLINEGIVEDRLTGLMWAQDASPNTFPQSWQDGLDFIRQLNSEGYFGVSDWRMPNRRELRSVIFSEAKNPCLYPEHPFLNVFSGWYWTSTTAAINPQYAWYVHLGGARMFYGRKDQECMVWPVRGESQVIPSTNQRKCYLPDGEECTCDGTGQDGQYQMGIKWPKPRFVVKDEVVEDLLTGLFWTREADLTNRMVTWNEALKRVEELGQEKYCGFSDWRLPNINELESLVDCSQHTPALSVPNPFQRVREFYWSSTTSFYEPSWAWALYMFKGAVGVGLKRLKNFYVWAVRG